MIFSRINKAVTAVSGRMMQMTVFSCKCLTKVVSSHQNNDIGWCENECGIH